MIQLRAVIVSIGFTASLLAAAPTEPDFDRVERWRKNGWKNRNGDPVRNIDLWRRLFVAKLRHKCKFIWVKGHASNEENNRCDALATAAADGSDLLEDEPFAALSS